MKINEPSALSTSKIQSSRTYGTPKAGNNGPASSGAGDSADKIDLNSQASLLSQAQSAGASDRSANVERLRALVQSGQYQVDPAALSSSIVNATIDGY
jgi:flagellar biosynthesis anti-sigma factor FlgM